MEIINVKCRGIKPLIFSGKHNPGAPRPSPKSKLAPRERAEKRIFRNPEGIPGLPINLLSRSLLIASKKHMMNSECIECFYSIMEKFIPINSTEWTPFVHVLHHVPRKKPFPDIFPMFSEWSFSFTVSLDFREYYEHKLRRMIEIAGRRVGLGFLSNRKGYYGRFDLVGWERK